MTVINQAQFNQFKQEFPEMVQFYPQINSASDREFMYEQFFAEELDENCDFEVEDYEYQQVLY